MPDYIIAHKAKWQQWIADLGDAAVNSGTPLGASRIVSAEEVTEDGGDNAMSGFSVVRADNLDAATKIAQARPFLDTGGILDIAQVM